MNDLDSIARTVAILERRGIDYGLFHCTSMYPTPYEKVRLGALAQLAARFPRAVLGLSDHSLGIYTCLAAVPLGARLLEKHFTSDKSWPGPDVPISITPDELRQLIEGSRAVFQALGGVKNVLPEEQPTIDFAYASVVTTGVIAKGTRFTRDNLWVKRPGTGEILAARYEEVLGRTATRDLAANALLAWSDVGG
jgi:N-acetylneuraminate synthase